MKKYFILAILFILAIRVHAKASAPADTIRRMVNEKTIVRDSTGKLYPYDAWQKMMRSGEYNMRPKDPYKDGKPNLDPAIEWIIAPGKPQRVTTRTYTTGIKRVINENTIVKDSAGQQYPYSIWHKMQQSGNYTLRPKNPIKDGKPNEDPNMEYILVPYKAGEKDRIKKLMGAPPASPYFITGQTLKPFKITDIAGQKITEEAWAGKTVVLNFWYTQGDICKQQIPDLNKIADKYADNPNVLFVAVSLSTRESIEELITKTPFNYHLIANGRQYALPYGIKTYPVNVVVNKQGKVAFHTNVQSLNVMDWIDKSIAESDSGKPSAQ